MPDKTPAPQPSSRKKVRTRRGLLKEAAPQYVKNGLGTSQNTGQEDLSQFDLMTNCLGYAIKRAQVRTYEKLFVILGPDALSPARITALSIIGTQPGTNQSELAAQLGINRASVVKVIDTLESLQLVERQANPENRRSYFLVLTEKGRDELHNLRSLIINQYEVAISANLSKEERDLLIKLLDKVAIAD